MVLLSNEAGTAPGYKCLMWLFDTHTVLLRMAISDVIYGGKEDFILWKRFKLLTCKMSNSTFDSNEKPGEEVIDMKHKKIK